MSLKTRIVTGVGALSEREWTACFPDEAEGWAYYRACEDAPPREVSVSAVEVSDECGLVAAAPLFGLSYRIDTPVQGRLRRFVDRITTQIPNLLEWRLLGVGSPFAERCHVALRPGLSSGVKREAVRKLIEAVEAEAEHRGAALVAYKDLGTNEDESLIEALGEHHYRHIRSLPVAALQLNDTDPDAYLRSLSRATRRDVRRKLKGVQGIRTERRTRIDDLSAAIELLYESTRASSAMRYGDFEELPRGYFRNISRALGERAVFMLYWAGDELAAFNLLLLEPDRVIDKFLGMSYPLARNHDLYVVSWMENVRFCLETGRHTLQSGQTAYASKVRLGSRLLPSRNFVKHRNAILNRAIDLAAPFLAFDRWDPDLRRLRAAGRLP